MKNIFLFSLVLLFSVESTAQDSQVQKTIFTKDSLFWAAYNACDISKMQMLVDDNVEFYHDKGGITTGKDALMKSIKDNLCSNTNFKTRREAIPETVKIYELKNGNETYGAIISGEHYFFNTYDGNPEKREGMAMFSQLWILKDNEWKMTRIFSYDHHEAPYQNLKKEILLSDEALARYEGTYNSPQAGQCNILKGNNCLFLNIADQKFKLIPETETTFFINDRDLTFEFIKNEKGEILKFIIRENDKIVDEAMKK
ncbi:MAG TPA: DUF4440 domain-containing protein [Bacteroidales bacterium]|nr:DUF4440 domain-containing protein [Bacteroidales bacterium]